MRTWVLLRGLAREARHWGVFPQLLQQQLPPGDQVLALDLPGNGRLWRERSPAAVDAMVESVRAQLRAQQQAGPVLLVGLSLGGMVAAQWAHRFRGEVQGCVLINSSFRGLSLPWQRLRPRAVGPLLASALPGVPLARRERTVLRLTSGLPVATRVLEEWVEHARSRPVAVGNVLRQMLAAARLRAPASWSTPGFVVASARDGLVSPRCSAAIACAWGLPLRVHPAAGHDLPLDDPEWLAGEIAGWAASRFVEPAEAAHPAPGR